MTGSIVDATGASVPNARITLHDRSSGEIARAVTGAEGKFRFENVLPGKYRVEVRHENFKPADAEVTWSLRSAPLRITLEIADLQQEVTVSDVQERLSTDTAANRDIVELDRNLLDGLPVMDQDFLAAAARFLDPSQIGSGGYSLVVDGMETSDIGVSPSAVREVRINNNPYSAEYSRPGRGRIEVSTIQESPAFHGSLNFLFRDHHLYARNAFAATRPPEQRRIFEGYLTGPLGKSGKTSFVASVERVEDEDWSVIFARTPSGLVREQFPQPERETELSFQIHRRPSDSRSYSLRYEWERESSRGRGACGWRSPPITW